MSHLLFRNTSSDIRRRSKERLLVQEGIAEWERKMQEEHEEKIRQQNEIRDMNESYKPWGKPGAGAPTENVRKKKFLTENESSENNNTNLLKLGKPGCGAPLRTNSGRLMTHLKRDPILGFQSVQETHRTVDNALRYHLPQEDRDNYRKDLERMIKIRKKQLEREKAELLQTVDEESDPWGKPGPGGKPWRRLQPLEEERIYQILGWTSEQKKALEEGRRLSHIVSKEREIKVPEFQSQEGIELVPLLQMKKVGRPRRDSATGFLLPNPLPHSDITMQGQLNSKMLPEHKTKYRQEITDHLKQQQNDRKKHRESEQESAVKHFETWEGFWGRPGHGAPCNGHVQRENLFQLLHQQHLGNKNDNMILPQS